jgi:hypothetical protein
MNLFVATYLARRYTDISKEVSKLFDALSDMLRSHEPELIAEWMRQYRAPKPKANSGEPVVDPFISKFQRRKFMHLIIVWPWLIHDPLSTTPQPKILLKIVWMSFWRRKRICCWTKEQLGVEARLRWLSTVYGLIWIGTSV